MTDTIWASGTQSTIPELFERRMATDPDGEYLDIGSVKLTARHVTLTAERFGGALHDLGTRQHDRVATLLENSPAALLSWAGTVCGGRISVPINTAYKGDYLSHQLNDSGARVLVVASSFVARVAAVVAQVPDLEHLVVVEDDEAGVENDLGEPPEETSWRGVNVHRWEDLLATSTTAPGVRVRPADLATFIYTGGTTGMSKGCMLSHNYHEALARQVGICWRTNERRRRVDASPALPFQRISHRRRRHRWSTADEAAIFRRFSVSQFWPEMNRVGATITSTLGTMAYLLAHDIDRSEMPRVGERTRQPQPAPGRRRSAAGRGRSSHPIPGSASAPSAGPTG